MSDVLTEEQRKFRLIHYDEEAGVDVGERLMIPKERISELDEKIAEAMGEFGNKIAQAIDYLGKFVKDVNEHSYVVFMYGATFNKRINLNINHDAANPADALSIPKDRIDYLHEKVVKEINRQSKESKSLDSLRVIELIVNESVDLAEIVYNVFTLGIYCEQLANANGGSMAGEK